MAETVSQNTWGFDQSWSTLAVQTGGLCHFPSAAPPDLGIRDTYTCYKGDGSLRKECLNSYWEDCLYSHFTPDGTGQMMRQVYDKIVADKHQKGQSYKTADMILGKEEGLEDVLLRSLREMLRPGVKYTGCSKSFEKRSCDGARPHSLPFVSGDFYRCIADIIYDETNKYQPQEEDIQCLHSLKGQPEFFRQPFLVFVKTDLVHNAPEHLKVIESTIPGPYILITHNSDFGVTTNETQQLIEELPKLIHWYGQNLQAGHTTTTIPIGLENRHWGRIVPELYTRVSGVSKRSLATASFRPRNGERQVLMDMLKSAEFVDTPGYGRYGSTTHEAWLRQQAAYKFAISPVGVGIDCHRTWEMILIGVVPVIMRETIVDSVFASLRAEGAVLMVKEWSELNRTMLEDHWRRFGEGLMKRHEDWMQRVPDNVMLAKHWIHRFSLHSNDPRVTQTIPTKGRDTNVN